MSFNIEVAESIYGTWHYHLREIGAPRSLCGKSVMLCHTPLDRWNDLLNHHIRESFCEECDSLDPRKSIEEDEKASRP